MQSENKVVPLYITPLYLSSLDKSQLVDLLQQKTQHLVAARISHLVDGEYLENIKLEVETLQAAINSRTEE